VSEFIFCGAYFSILSEVNIYPFNEASLIEDVWEGEGKHFLNRDTI
jgi:hypothetical protein